MFLSSSSFPFLCNSIHRSFCTALYERVEPIATVPTSKQWNANFYWRVVAIWHESWVLGISWKGDFTFSSSGKWSTVT